MVSFFEKAFTPIKAYLSALSPSPWGAFMFSVRTWLSSMLAFWIACKLQLDSPQWAVTTVWIVARPETGIMLSRSFYRLWGTLLGCFFGMMLIIFFSQTPGLFIVALALLMGLCTLFSNLMTNFRAYAAVLTGYTAAIVSLGAIDSPESIFYITMARGSCILLGIACSVVVSSLFAPQFLQKQALAGLKNALIQAARRAAFPWAGDDTQRKILGRNLINQLIRLDALLEFASAESTDFRVHQAAARSLPVHIFGMISEKRSLDAHVKRCGMPPNPALVQVKDDCYSLLEKLAERIEREEMTDIRNEIDDLRARLALLNPEELEIPPSELVSHRIIIDRLDGILSEIGNAVDDWLDFRAGRKRTEKLVTNFHRDQRSAAIHALRAFLAVAAMGAFWIASAWPSGPGALIMVAILISLFSSVPRPDRVGWGFFKASCVAMVLAFICKFLLLPHAAEITVFALVLGIFLIPCGLIFCHPKTNGFAAAFSISVFLLFDAHNVMDYNLTAFLNVGLATLVGCFGGTLPYLLVFPPDPAIARTYTLYRIRLSLELISLVEPCPPVRAWTTRMYDRVSRLQDPERPNDLVPDQWLNVGLEAIDLGNEVYRLRQLLENPALPKEFRQVLEKVRVSFTNFVAHPDQAVLASRFALSQAEGISPTGDRRERRMWARAVGVLAEIRGYFSHSTTLLHPVQDGGNP